MMRATVGVLGFFLLVFGTVSASTGVVNHRFFLFFFFTKSAIFGSDRQT